MKGCRPVPAYQRSEATWTNRPRVQAKGYTAKNGRCFPYVHMYVHVHVHVYVYVYVYLYVYVYVERRM